MSDEVVTIDGVAFRKGRAARLFSPKPGGDGISFEIELLVSADQNLILEGDLTRSAFGSTPEVLEADIRALHFVGETGLRQLNTEYGCD